MPCDEREKMTELCRIFQDKKESTRFDKLIEELGMLLELSGCVEPCSRKLGLDSGNLWKARLVVLPSLTFEWTAEPGECPASRFASR